MSPIGLWRISRRLALLAVLGMIGGATPARADFLRVASQNNAGVLRHDGLTGHFLGTFVPPDSGGAVGPGGAAVRYGYPNGRAGTGQLDSDRARRGGIARLRPAAKAACLSRK